MFQKKNKTSSRLSIACALIFAFCIYLLCTGFMKMTYDGVYVGLEKSPYYSVSNGSVDYDADRLSGREVISGVSFDVIKDADDTVVSLESITDDLSKDLSLKVTINPTAESELGITEKTYKESTVNSGEIKEGYTVSVVLQSAEKNIDSFKCNFKYDEAVLKPVYVFDNSQSMQLEFTAFEMLLGSQSNLYFHFSGNIWAIFLWLPSVLGVVFSLIFRGKNTGNVLGMVCSMGGILSIAYMIGGARLTFSSMISIILYILIFTLCVLSAMKMIQGVNDENR